MALAFNDPNAEARHIVESIPARRGVASAEDGVERGLSYSDMAILLRSVKANAEPITRALQVAGVPFVVTGMTNLFATPEAKAARQLLYFMAGRDGVDTAALRNTWQAADLGLDPAALDRAIAQVTKAKAALTDPEQKRWGQCSIQHVFLSFLDQAGVREELVPGGRGEVVFYNLGKFSQVITDFETIHYQSKPVEKYDSFARFLEHRAEDAYPEGWQGNQYANPDAVRIMTVHQAKGMQWPVVFVPALLKNRFPAKKPGSRDVWHLLPRAGITRLTPQPRAGVANVVLSFSDLKYFFECPYPFKLRILSGFNAPIHEALGYGQSLHDALAEVHARAIRGDVAAEAEVSRLLETHLHAPYAYPALREALEEAAERVIRNYLRDNRDLTGRRPDYVEVYELDAGKRTPRSVDDDFITDVKQKVRDATAALRANTLPPAPTVLKCRNCDTTVCARQDAPPARSLEGRHDELHKYPHPHPLPSDGRGGRCRRPKACRTGRCTRLPICALPALVRHLLFACFARSP